jgi:hypothetical protein
MEIRVQIDELVLDGFNYHDHLRIAAAIERELAKMIRERGHDLTHAPQQLHKIDAGSFKVPSDMNPRLIGAGIARSLYNGLKR